MSCSSCGNQNTPPSGNPITGPGSYVSNGGDDGGMLSHYFYSLKAAICPKCATFWFVLAIIAVALYALKRRG